MTAEFTESDLQAVIKGLVAAEHKEVSEIVQPLLELAPVKAAVLRLQEGDFEGFFFQWSFPLSHRITSGLAIAAFGPVPELQFLARHYDFLQSQLRWAFNLVEGPGCCADKARSVIALLFRHFKEGKPLVFNYEQRYTFHLPREILKTPEELEAFFGAVSRLMAGRPEEYSRWVAKITAKAPPLPPLPPL